jgi:hypothetical protein
MTNQALSFQSVVWNDIPKTEHAGENGTAFWQTMQFPGLRIRIVEYSQHYKADHWCELGHIVHCLEGEFTSELKNGEIFQLSKGMSYIVSDKMSSHRSVTKTGARLLIIDGDFLGT